MFIIFIYFYQILWRKSCDINPHMAHASQSYEGYRLTDFFYMFHSFVECQKKKKSLFEVLKKQGQRHGSVGKVAFIQT